MSKALKTMIPSFLKKTESEAQADTATKKKASNSKHSLSTALASDARVKLSPRHVETLATNDSFVVLAKIYPSLIEKGGSELMTISTVVKAKGTQTSESEFRFDELFAQSLHFKTQNDEERCKHAKNQLEKTLGAAFAKDPKAAIENLLQGIEFSVKS